MALPLSGSDIQFQVTNTARAYLNTREQLLRYKVVLDTLDLMAAPYSMTQAENDILKGCVNDALYGYGQTTLINLELQAGLF